MGLRLKYNIALFLACSVGITAATGVSFFIVRKSATEEIMQSIRLLRSNALAVRSYTLNSINPLLADNDDILFLPETVTSYAARSVFSTFQKQFPEFSYKEAALNPTNPADLPNELETKMIEQLRADKALEHVSAIVENDTGRFFTVAFPLTITQEKCLTCHSVPDVAPPAMVDLYDPDNGFGWKLGETVGAQIISAPMSVVDERAKETGIILFSGLLLIFILVFILTNLMLGRIVVGPVRRMSAIAEKVSMGDFSQPEYSKPGQDEISSLSVSFNRMRRSLERAMSMLND